MRANILLYPFIIALAFTAEHAQADTISIWRLFNPKIGDHLYTKSCFEVSQAQSAYGYVYEGLGFYSFSDQQPSTIPLYRFFGHGEHFYTASEAERTSVLGNGYIAEETVGYIYPGPGGNRQPLYRSASASSGTHFYTIDKQEHDAAISKLGHRDEGITGYLPITGGAQCTPAK